MSSGGTGYLEKIETLYVWPVRGDSSAKGELPRTGQTATYGTNDDGALQKGAVWPALRFVVTNCDDNGPCPDPNVDCDGNPNNDMVTDELTGLTWTRHADIGGRPNWQGALNYANTLSLCGHGDWRLPNRKELRSLHDQSKYDPSLPAGNPFVSVASSYYWSSTTQVSIPYYAEIVQMQASFSIAADKQDTQYYPVWPVRGPSANLSVTLQGNGSGVIHSTTLDITCSSGTCSQDYPFNSIINLTPIAADHSLFSGWSGHCTGSSIPCTVTMDQSRSVLATFSINPAEAVWIDPGTNYYNSISAAYQAPISGVTSIKACRINFPENLLFNLGKTIILSGGYDSSYSDNSGLTTVTGTMILSNGSMTVGNIAIK
jgi:hypothetical protein